MPVPLSGMPKITGQTLSMVFGFTSPAWSLGQAQFFFSFDLSLLKSTPERPGLSKL